MSGFYLMRRGWRDHPVFAREPYTEREAWQWLIEEAAFSSRKRRVSGDIVEVQRGQLIVSVRFLAGAWQWSKSRVDRFLTRLEREFMIGTAAGRSATVITLCNYDKYQFLREVGGTQPGTPAGHQRDTSGTNYKEGKEGLLLEEAKASSRHQARTARGSRLVAGWEPTPEGRQFCTDLGLDYPTTLAEFVDYWASIPGQRGVRLDWEATWRNRCRELAGRKGRNGRQPQRNGDLDIWLDVGREFDATGDDDPNDARSFLPAGRVC